MKRVKKHRKYRRKPVVIIIGSVLLLLVIPLTIYVVLQRQNYIQNAQMTPPPAPPGCYYKPQMCPTQYPCTPSDPKYPYCENTCDPVLDELICPNISVSPAFDVSSDQQNSQSNGKFNFLILLQNWFNSLFQAN